MVFVCLESHIRHTYDSSVVGHSCRTSDPIVVRPSEPGIGHSSDRFVVQTVANVFASVGVPIDQRSVGHTVGRIAGHSVQVFDSVVDHKSIGRKCLAVDPIGHKLPTVDRIVANRLDFHHMPIQSWVGQPFAAVVVHIDQIGTGMEMSVQLRGMPCSWHWTASHSRRSSG